MTRAVVISLLFGLGAGLFGCAEYDGPPPAYGPQHHVRWCLNHHRGYNPNTNLFPDRFGQLRPCEHP